MTVILIIFQFITPGTIFHLSCLREKFPFFFLLMAYIPPHKRHSKSKDNEGSSSPSPKPELLSPLFNKNLKFRSTRTNNAHQKTGKIIYADKAISRWFSVGLDDNNNQFPASVHLQSVSLESHELKVGEKPLALFNNDLIKSQYLVFFFL